MRGRGEVMDADGVNFGREPYLKVERGQNGFRCEIWKLPCVGSREA